MTDKSLPTGPALAAQLFDLGLAPDECVFKSYAGEPACLMWQGRSWQPWRNIAHCWDLVERFGLSINYAPMPYRTFRQPWWWVAAHGIEDIRVATFAEVPVAICWAAILVQEGRMGV